MANKRFIPRKKRRLRVRLNDVITHTVDVSPGGFCAEMSRVNPPGTMVHGTLQVADQEFEYTGVVTWAKEGDRALYRGRMGIRFTGIDPRYYSVYEQHFGKLE